MSKILGMMPGMSQYREQIENFDDREVDRIEALILSMTPAERANPKLIDGSRRTRIARGAGRSVSDVNDLVDRFYAARKMIQSAASGGMPGLPGLPGFGGGKRAKARQAPQRGRKKRGSGNPAKRAAQEAAVRAGAAEPDQDGAAAFGFGQSGGERAGSDYGDFELPKELRDLL
jgi:signal recognition particle subunit SRP54